MTGPRKPASFRIEPEDAGRPREEAVRRTRRPAAMPETSVTVVPDEVDVFDEPDLVLREPPPADAPKRRSRWTAIFLTAFGTLLSLAVGLWLDRLIRDLFSRADWLGWVAAAAAAVAVLALAVILGRELLALARLASIEKLHRRAEQAFSRNDAKAARAIVSDLVSFVSHKPETAAGRRALLGLRDDVIDGSDLLKLAETEILSPLDERAKVLVLDAAKRVSLVTAVSPRALVDIAYVVFEAARLIRRLAELYGGRPGTLGFFRLARSVLAHLAVTGSIAVGDGFVQQIIGHGLAARLSARLGEGVVNGMMTARIGIAAIEATRPLPFRAVPRPGMRDFLTALTSFARQKQARQDSD